MKIAAAKSRCFSLARTSRLPDKAALLCETCAPQEVPDAHSHFAVVGVVDIPVVGAGPRGSRLRSRSEVSGRECFAYPAGGMEPSRPGRLHGRLLEFAGSDILFRCA